MKKIFAVLAAVVFSAVALSAQERSVHSIGLSVPVWNQTAKTGFFGDDAYNYFASGLDFMYHNLKVNDSYFSSFVNVAFGWSRFSLRDITSDGYKIDADKALGDYNKPLDGLNTHFTFGLGGAPIATDVVTLAVHGTFGLSSAVGTCTWSEPGYSWYDGYYTVDARQTVFGVWTTLGVNVEAAFNFTGNFGLLAGVNVYTNLFGVDFSFTDGGSRSGFDIYRITPGRFNADFRLGVAFVF